MRACAVAVASIAVALCAVVPLSSSSEAQRRSARRPPRVIHLDMDHCHMGRWPAPELVLVAREPVCPIRELVMACGGAAPETCPLELAEIDAASLATCAPTRRVLVSLTQVIDQVGIGPLLDGVLERLGARGGAVTDPTDRVLLAELLRRDSRYAAAAGLVVAMADDGTDPALAAFALERLVAMLAYDDWNEDQQDDLDLASHVTPPLLPDRPWAIEIARRVLARTACDGPRAQLITALRARFPEEPWPLAWSSPTQMLGEGPGDWDGVDPRMIAQRVRALPLASCSAPPSSVLGVLRIQPDGSLYTATTHPCLDVVMSRLAPIQPAALFDYIQQSFVFVFAEPR